ncbi:FMN-linked oxidoreductase [Schizopora paradoxa]|uniref:FMN-linked oxidoreductase n=1 Tax=Schizopora paradoxa TaxID=27342 RepID=A0A0H2RAZ0_9AGAM|nr:FMN-linked oxidoreductase [Schizopora paradoxa]
MLANTPAPNTSYFTPAQIPPSGTATNPQPDGSPIPKLFQPLKIRGAEFRNRIFVSPMCQYSADNGAMTAWHMAHLGGIFTRGPGLTMIEATAVVPQGRITPEDTGLWSDTQVEPLRKIVEFAHSQGQKIGIQLAHAGRKATMVAPWLCDPDPFIATEEHNGWPDDVWAPSAIPHAKGYPEPKALSRAQIKELVKAWADAAKRALRAGVDVVEIHNAHGYLLHAFMSPVSNKRIDEYGGSFENRIRFTLEVVDAVRAVIPESMPLFLRISVTDWLEEVFPDEPSWKIEDTIKLAGILAEHGVDLIDISSAGISQAQKPRPGPLTHAYQSYLSEAVRKVHGVEMGSATKDGKKGIYVGAVGGIRTGKIANAVLENGEADIAFVGKQFQKDPSSVWTFAEDLGVQIKLANQIEWSFKGRGSNLIKKIIEANKKS